MVKGWSIWPPRSLEVQRSMRLRPALAGFDVQDGEAIAKRLAASFIVNSMFDVQCSMFDVQDGEAVAKLRL